MAVASFLEEVLLIQSQSVYRDVLPGSCSSQDSHPALLFLLFSQVVLKGLVAFFCLGFILTDDTRMNNPTGINLFIHPDHTVEAINELTLI